MKSFKSFLASSVLAMSFLAQPAIAAEEWDIKLDVQASKGDYSGSTQRNDVNSLGAFVSAEYLDKAGFTFGYNRTKIDFKSNIKDIDQDVFYASARTYITPDKIPGKFTVRLDLYKVDNNDPTQNTDEGRIFSPQVSYISFDKNWYLDLGYTHSNYSGSLSLDQWTPTVAFAFNNKNDWLQVRGYFIDSSNSARTQGEGSTDAVEVKLTHYFAPGAALGVDRFYVTALVGERMFAVDPDAASVYNLADIQKGSLSVGAAWDLNDSWDLLFIAGAERYDNQSINDEYDSRYAYFNISKKW